jgi:hypothetical protein
VGDVADGMLTIEEAGRALGVSSSTSGDRFSVASWRVFAAPGGYSDKDWTLCDAISFAVLDSRRITRAFTFDHHFRYGRIQILGL